MSTLKPRDTLNIFADMVASEVRMPETAQSMSAVRPVHERYGDAFRKVIQDFISHHNEAYKVLLCPDPLDQEAGPDPVEALLCQRTLRSGITRYSAILLGEAGLEGPTFTTAVEVGRNIDGLWVGLNLASDRPTSVDDKSYHCVNGRPMPFAGIGLNHESDVDLNELSSNRRFEGLALGLSSVALCNAAFSAFEPISLDSTPKR